MYIIRGAFAGKKLQTPKVSTTRPTKSQVREALFNILQNQLAGARFLDIFAGSGCIGLEAMSRGAIHTSFIEKHPAAVQAIVSNVQTLQIQDRVKIIQGDVRQEATFKKKAEGPYDIIFMDPPYQEKDLQELLLNILKKISSFHLLRDKGKIFIETSKKSPFTAPAFYHSKIRTYGSTALLELGLSPFT